MTTSTVVSQKTTRIIELAITGAPPLKADYEYHDVTGLRLTYEGDQLTKLTVLGTSENSGEAEEIGTRLDCYDMVQPWIRDEVEKHRPSRLQSAYRATVLHEAADIAGEPIPEGAPTDEWEDLIEAIEAIREKATEAERHAVPAMDPKEFLGLYFNIGS
ncbi:hypothetical protein ACTWJ9_33415 (plasmid) [Streptomyces sp. GDS52]|uniref:hypothetical protein n=1 Tax=Streptomyces sp. GDS52 TaxID=3406419 RepID=UPI003FD5C23A